MMKPSIKTLLVPLGVITIGLIVTEPAFADDCFARLLRGEWNSGDCGNTDWDQMAPILAFGAVLLAIVAIVVAAALLPAGIVMATGFAFTYYSVATAYIGGGIKGIINEFSPHNDFYNARTATNPWDRATCCGFR